MNERGDTIRRVVWRRGPRRSFRPWVEVVEERQLLSLSIGLTVNNTSPNVGQRITYTITLGNSGGAVNNVQVTDLLPSSVAFASSTASQGTYNGSTGLWNVGNVAANSTATLSVAAIPILVGSQVDTATITAGGSGSASVTIVAQEVDVSVAVSNNVATVPSTPAVPSSGEQAASVGGDPGVTYYIVVTNAADYTTAHDVVVTDVWTENKAGATKPGLDTGPNAPSPNPNASQGSYDFNTGVWNVGDLAANSSAVLQVTVSADPSSTPADTTFTDTATLTQVQNPQGNPVPNADLSPTGNASFIAKKVDVTVTQAVDVPTPSIGSNVTITTTVSNAAGYSAADNVSINDSLPAGLALVSATPSQGTFNNASGFWTTGPLLAGDTATVKIVATVVNAGVKTVTATATPNWYNANPNASASVTVTPQQIQLSLGQTVDNPRPDLDGDVTFTVTIGNGTGSGIVTATGVVVNDPLPAGLSFVSATPSQGSYDNSTGAWSVGSLNPGASAMLQITAQVTTPGAKTVTATATANQFSGEATLPASVTVTPQGTNLSISQSVDNPTPALDTNVTFTVTLNEAAGSATANGVQVSDLLPAGLSFVSAAPSQGTYNAGSGSWTVGSLAPNSTVTLKIVATVTVAMVDLTNTATITAVSPPNQSLDTSASATVIAQQVNLGIAQSVDNPTPNVGDDVTFTITLKNIGGAGFSAATDVQVADLLPPGLSFVSATASQGVYSGTLGLWAVGALPVGGVAALQIVAQVIASGASVNTATITSAVPTDVNPQTQASATVTAPAYNLSDLSAISYLINGTKTVSSLAGNVNAGDDVQVTFTVAAGVTDQISLASYIVPGQGSKANTSGTLSLFESATGSFSAGTYSLSVIVPNSFFQLDFVFGPVIPNPGPSSYSSQGRLIAQASGGKEAFGTSSVSGSVFVDSLGNGVKEFWEAGIAGVSLELEGTDYLGNAVALYATTNVFGVYTFLNVPASGPAGYTIVNLLSQQTPLGQEYAPTVAVPGTLGGVGGDNNQITGIFVNANNSGLNYNFGEKKTS